MFNFFVVSVVFTKSDPFSVLRSYMDEEFEWQHGSYELLRQQKTATGENQ